MPEKFSTKYESVMVFGSTSEAIEQEKQTALEGLLSKYSQDFYSKGQKFIKSYFNKTRVFGISIKSITGKSLK